MVLFFYIFAGLVLFSSVMVILSRNPVHSVLWLIFTFCNGSGLMVLMGAEFIAMMLIVIYVGAVAVLFLFVIMMLNIKFTEFKSAIGSEISFAAAIMLLLFTDLVIIILLGTKVIDLPSNNKFTILPEISNAHTIGNLLYTTFILPFQTAGLVLFVAMVASISLTLRLRLGVKRQNIAKQLGRNKGTSLRLEKVKLKSGISDLNYDD